MSISKKRVQLLVGQGRILEGDVHIPDGQALVGFLGTRKHFLNLTSVAGMPGGADEAPIAHLAVRVDQVVWIRPLDPEFALSTVVGPNARPRGVRLLLVGGKALAVKMRISNEQRLTDYFDSNTGFIPLYDAQIDGSDQTMPELAVNHRAILALQELTDTDPKASRQSV
jgi:hypothetical protein